MVKSLPFLRKRPETKSKTWSALEDAAKAVLGQRIERSKDRARMRGYESIAVWKMMVLAKQTVVWSKALAVATGPAPNPRCHDSPSPCRGECTEYQRV